MITEDALLISSRFCGPPRSGNGGYTVGSLVEALFSREVCGRAVTVTLRLPPPLDTVLPLIREEDGGITAKAPNGAVVADAKLAENLPAAPAFVDMQTADAATLEYRGWDDHPFPSCFVCGTKHGSGDGLRLFTGPVADRKETVATVWRPGAGFSEAALNPDFSGSSQIIPTRIACGALDCPGAWAADFGTNQPIVLGRMNAVIHAPLTVEKEYVVVGERRDRQGRKHFTATAIYDTAGGLLAVAEAIWISIDLATFAGLGHVHAE